MEMQILYLRGKHISSSAVIQKKDKKKKEENPDALCF